MKEYLLIIKRSAGGNYLHRVLGVTIEAAIKRLRKDLDLSDNDEVVKLPYIYPEDRYGVHGSLYQMDGSLWRLIPSTGGFKDEGVRRTYAQSHSRIHSVQQLKEELRTGWVSAIGGYYKIYLTECGKVYSWEAVMENWREVLDCWIGGHRTGWKVVAVASASDLEGPLTCDFSGELLVEEEGDYH